MFVFGEDGIIARAEQAKLETEVASVREQLEMAEASAMADGAGRIDMDHYWEILEDEDIIGSKDTDVSDDDGDGTYEVVTDEGFIFDITPLPDEENTTDIVIDYVGTAEGPRISKIEVTEMTSNSVTIKVTATNANKGTYTYEYRKKGDSDWIPVEGQGDTCKLEGLEQGRIYEVKVTVETNQGKASKTEEVKAGELTDAPIEFSMPTWSAGKASITVSTTAGAEYRLQYQVDGKEEGNWTDIANWGTIDNLSYNDTVYARLYDGVNGTDPASTTIVDNNPPTVTVTATEGTVTSNSIGVSVSATDGESGMKGSSTYTYSIKGAGQPDSSYTTPSGASNIAANSYTFTGLSPQTGYDIKVTVDGDNAGNTGTGTLTNQVTPGIPGGNDAIASGAIKFGTPTWSGTTASVTVSTNTSYQLQYQIGSTTGTWTNISNGGTISGINNGTTVYARLTDGVNVGNHASITISDNTPPSASMSTEPTHNTIEVTVSASDSGSGLATSGTYKYYLNGSLKATSENRSYTFTGLSPETTYEVKVEVADKLNQITTLTESVTTYRQPATNVSQLKEGDIVLYKEAKRGKNERCVVLYDSSSSYGVQVIYESATGLSADQITLGQTGVVINGGPTDKTVADYNDAINILNEAAREFLNTDLATSARCVGSVPNNPDYDAAGTISSSYSYLSKYTGVLKNTDSNYSTDWNQMQKLDITHSMNEYWLASRRAVIEQNNAYFSVLCTIDRGEELSDNNNFMLWLSSGSPSTQTFGVKKSLRPVFTLKSNLQIVEGYGTFNDPYVFDYDYD